MKKETVKQFISVYWHLILLIYVVTVYASWPLVMPHTIYLNEPINCIKNSNYLAKTIKGK